MTRAPSKRSLNRKLYDPKCKEAIFAVLHTPPKEYGCNRTTWRRKDLHETLIRKRVQIGKNYLDLIIRNEGLRVRHTKTVRTSIDPQYREKVDAILKILQRAKPTERFSRSTSSARWRSRWEVGGAWPARARTNDPAPQAGFYAARNAAEAATA